MTPGPHDGQTSRISPWKFVMLTSTLVLLLVVAATMLLNGVSRNDADEQAWTERQTLTHEPAYVYSVAFSPDGKLLATVANHDVKVWTTRPFELTAVLTGHRDSVRSLSFSPDSSLLASSSDDCSARLWDVDSAKQLAVLDEHAGNVNAVSFAPDGKSLASAADDSFVILWDVASQRAARKLKHTSGINAVCFSPDGKTLVTAGDSSETTYWNLATGKESMTSSGHTERVWSLAYSPDGMMLATAGEDGLIHFRNAKTGKLLNSFSEPSEDIWSLAFSTDGSLLAIGMGGTNQGLTTVLGQLFGLNEDESYTGTLVLWDVAANKRIAAARSHRDWIRSVSFSDDGAMLASGSDDGTVKLWTVPPREVNRATSNN